ncbi:MAG: hypothetical protein HY332_21465 [Chloroflexi bacterium]|nr:hypothetical protein [Chloroflexota bacterium]
MLQPLTEHVFGWTAHVPSSSRPGVTYAFNDFALALPEAGGVELVDAPPLTEEECEQLERLGTPTHVLLTCEWHTRAAARHRERWSCRVLMHEAGVAKAEVPIDGVLEDGALLWDAVRVIHLPDVYHPEEVALLVEATRPAPCLIVGDALSGGREDQGIPDGEVALHAPRYVADFTKAHASLSRLPELPFDAVGFGHGRPVLVGGRAAVERCLRSEVAWLATGGREGNLSRLAGWPARTLYERYRAAADERARGVPALAPD